LTHHLGALVLRRVDGHQVGSRCGRIVFIRSGVPVGRGTGRREEHLHADGSSPDGSAYSKVRA
jgi:hypothetical protein